MKRLFDVVSAGIGLAIALPLMLIIAAAVRMDSPGPVFYRQVRVGRGGKQFQILKFRSMRFHPTGAATGALITVAGDSRVTRVGAFLRRTKLDELPQLINVVRGEMSLVGPRPEVPKYVSFYPADARVEILSVRPGITDEAAIEFSDEGSLLAGSLDPERTYIEEILPRKIAHYRRYVRSHSVTGDISILLRTLARIIGMGRNLRD